MFLDLSFRSQNTVILNRHSKSMQKFNYVFASYSLVNGQPNCELLRHFSLYLQRSFPSDYIRHVYHAFIIIFETRHTGLIMTSLNVLVKLLPSSPFRLFLCFFIGARRFLSASCFYFHLLQFLGLCSL